MFGLGTRPAIREKPFKLSADRRRLRKARPAYQTRLRFEPLEDRRLLAIFMVTNTNDGAVAQAGDLPGSLRQAIFDANAAAGADTIQFASGLSGGTITLTAGELFITDSLTIQGLGAANLTIDANGGSRIFNLDDGNSAADINVSIDGLTLTGGSATGANGGAIFSRENLTVSNSTITGNSAGHSGGGIYAALGLGATTILNSTLSGNTAGNDGGGLYSINSAATRIQNSTISGNTAADGGGIGGAPYSGGTLTILDSTISGNSATSDGGGFWGGGDTGGTVTLQNSTIYGNFANGNGGGFWAATFGTTTIQNSTISGNTSDADSNGSGSGGGVYSSQGTVSVQSTIVATNTDNTSTAPDMGGAGTVTASNSLIGDNTGSGFVGAPVGTPDANGNLIGDPTGAGILDPDLGPLANHGGPTFTQALLTASPALDMGSNPAGLTSDQRGAPFVRSAAAAVDIGAYEAQTLNLVVTTANDTLDPTYDPANLSLRDALALTNANPGTDTISFASALNGNTITLSLGELAITDSGTIDGPGAANLTIDAAGNSRIFDVNHITEAAVSDVTSVTYIDVTIDGLTLTGGSATGADGGAIYSAENLTVSNSTITGNTTDGNGGGIYALAGGEATAILDSTISGNTAGGNGGGLYLTGFGATIIQNSTISGNTATSDGGGIWGGGNTSGTMTIQNTTISGNFADGNGGGFWAFAFGTTTIQNSTISGNTSDADSNGSGTGGGIYSSQGTLSVQSTIVAGNTDNTATAPDIGGAGSVTLSNSLIGDNTGSGLSEAPVGSPDADGNLIGGPTHGIIDADLGPLANNGGPTLTQGLLAGSPALDMGSNPASLATDQRGAPLVRSAGAAVDIGAYEYQPFVTSISPTAGPMNGGTIVTITGLDLTGATVVVFGGTPTTNLVIDSSTQITATSPPHTPGTVDVTVVTPVGTSATTAADQFSFVAPSGIGLYDSTTPLFFLRNTTSLQGPGDQGFADETFVYGSPGLGIPIAGDWTGSGTDTVGLYSTTMSVFYLKNSNSSGLADTTFAYGPANNNPPSTGEIPIAGDWNGDGTDTIGLYDPTTSVFYLRNSNSSGFADIAFAYGPANGGLVPIAGDWNGDGTDTIGLYNPTTSVFYLRNSNSSGFADVTFVYGPANTGPAVSGQVPIVGDWNADGTDTVGLFNSTTSVFSLRNSNSTGFADITMFYGPFNGGLTPLAGDWATSQPLLAANQVVASASTPALTQGDLQPIVRAAIARWASAGLNATTVQKLSQVQFVISDLPGSYLGQTAGNRVSIDVNAAGNGWFVDPTPAADAEFAASSGSRQQLVALDPQAVDRIDLLTVVEHELGHVAGLGDLDASANDVMSGLLGIGIRRNASHMDAVFAS